MKKKLIEFLFRFRFLKSKLSFKQGLFLIKDYLSIKIIDHKFQLKN
jgi:hypothetical protein